MITNTERLKIEEKINFRPVSCVLLEDPKALDSAHYLSIWGGEIGGRRKKEVSFTIYTKNPLLLEESSANLKGTKKKKKKCFLQTLLRCAPEASASIQVNSLHIKVLKITCIV